MAELFHIKTISGPVLEAVRAATLNKLHAVVCAGIVHEVGSTAIPGTIGKQDLDFLVLAPKGQFLLLRERLDSVFARNDQQLTNAHYQGYLVESNLDVAIQLTVAGSQFDTFLAFKTRLLANPALVRDYNQLKTQFDGQPMDLYRHAKRRFIEQTLGVGQAP